MSRICALLPAVLALLALTTGDVAAASVVNILDMGAVPNIFTQEAAATNGYIIWQLLTAAGTGNDHSGGVVLVPAGYTFAYFPKAQLVGLSNVVFQIDGTLILNTSTMKAWPNEGSGSTSALAAIDIRGGANISIVGAGTIDGRGYDWWWYVILSGLDHRPHLIKVSGVTGLTLAGFTLRNSPMYHIITGNCVSVLIEYITIRVDIVGQKTLLRQAGRLGPNDVPTFPLNTDGIDVAGTDIIVRHCDIENFDDSLCIKPSSGLDTLTQCTSNVYLYNHTIRFGVGASVGSVPPSPHVNCIRDIVFDTVRFTFAIKTIYVKPNPCPNPATDGTGIIHNVTYLNIDSTDPITWPIWVSTQQQEQPGSGTNTHCSFFFPLPGTTCPTQPCVPVTSLTLRNVNIVGGALSAGVLRCHPLNPCRDFLFDNVRVQSTVGFPFGNTSYLCQAIDSFTFVNSFPSKCITNASQLMSP